MEEFPQGCERRLSMRPTRNGDGVLDTTEIEMWLVPLEARVLEVGTEGVPAMADGDLWKRSQVGWVPPLPATTYPFF